MKKNLTGLTLCLTLACTAAYAMEAVSPAAHAVALAEYKQALSTYFTELDEGWVPVFSGGSQAVGNIYDATARNLIESAAQCFPRLTVNAKSASLPPVTTVKRNSVGFFFRAQEMLGLGASGATVRIVSIEFDDVTREEASEGDLKRAFQQAKCENLTPVLDKARVAPGNGAQAMPLLIGRVYRGKRRAVLATTSEQDFAATLKAVNAAVAGKKLDVQVQAGASTSSQRIIRIVDPQPVALAFAPAFVPAAVSGVSQGGEPPKTIYFQWRPYDVVGAPSHRQILRELAVTAGEAWQWDTPAADNSPRTSSR